LSPVIFWHVVGEENPYLVAVSFSSTSGVRLSQVQDRIR
jgi:hypothetical protein